MAVPTASPLRQRAAGALLWFGVVGGAIAWAVQLIAAWGTAELACLAGHEGISGTRLSTVVGLMVGIPGGVALAAFVVSAVALRRTGRRRSDADGDRRLGRTRLLATVGFWANLLFLAIIAFDGAAVVVIPQCTF